MAFIPSVIAEPEAYIFVVVLEIVGAFTMLLVLHPLSLILFAITEGINLSLIHI